MWYEGNYRRHLCDMHIDDWDEAFLSRFSAKDYFLNLQRGRVRGAMIYFQSHVGLCYWPTKSGRMHNAFRGREDEIRKLTELCRENGMAVTGYYSLIYNNWAHDTHPQWRMVGPDGRSKREASEVVDSAFSQRALCRYGLCCPNNEEYRAFVAEQIHEMADYFQFDGMFFDMLFWLHPCYCDSCRRRWAEEVGGELPTKEDWSDPRWQLHMEKRRQWMGEFAQFATATLKERVPSASVEHNVASLAEFDNLRGAAEEVLAAKDFAGGDLYGGIYSQSFICKFYRNATKNQPFEYMLARCTPTLAKHTVTKSEEVLRSEVAVTAAHHGATLFIDAIDPVGTLDNRVYDRLRRVFGELERYEPYFRGEMVEDVGIYYSLRGKFNAHGEPYSNHASCVNLGKTMLMNHICTGVTGSFHSLEGYRILLAPGLTAADSRDYGRIAQYVRQGGQLYLSGGDCPALLKELFGAEVTGRTPETVIYIAPGDRAGDSFGWFNEQYPLHFDGSAPIVGGIDPKNVLATVTLPYTRQDSLQFASIHSNPPGIPTQIPALALTDYGKGKVLWSAVNLEGIDLYQYREVFLNLLNTIFRRDDSFRSDGPEDVEITLFRTEDSLLASAVQLKDGGGGRVPPFEIAVRCEKAPGGVRLLPEEREVPFRYEDGWVRWKVDSMDILAMFEIR